MDEEEICKEQNWSRIGSCIRKFQAWSSTKAKNKRLNTLNLLLNRLTAALSFEKQIFSLLYLGVNVCVQCTLCMCGYDIRIHCKRIASSFSVHTRASYIFQWCDKNALLLKFGLQQLNFLKKKWTQKTSEKTKKREKILEVSSQTEVKPSLNLLLKNCNYTVESVTGTRVKNKFWYEKFVHWRKTSSTKAGGEEEKKEKNYVDEPWN